MNLVRTSVLTLTTSIIMAGTAFTQEQNAEIKDISLTTVNGTLKSADLELLKKTDRIDFLKSWAKSQNLNMFQMTVLGEKTIYTTLDGLAIEGAGIEIPSEVKLEIPAFSFESTDDHRTTTVVSSSSSLKSLKFEYLMSLIQKHQSLARRTIDEGRFSLGSSISASLELAESTKNLLDAFSKKETAKTPEEEERVDAEVLFATLNHLNLRSFQRRNFEIPALEALQILLENYKAIGLTPQDAVALDNAFHSNFEDVAVEHENYRSTVLLARLDNRVAKNTELAKKIDENLDLRNAASDLIKKIAERHETWAAEIFEKDPEIAKIRAELNAVEKMILDALKEQAAQEEKKKAPRF